MTTKRAGLAKKRPAAAHRPAKRPRNDRAPNGVIRPRSKCEASVFSEIFHKGKGTASELAQRMAKRGEIFTKSEVQAALDAWKKRGWMAMSGRKMHLSAAALEYLR